MHLKILPMRRKFRNLKIAPGILQSRKKMFRKKQILIHPYLQMSRRSQRQKKKMNNAFSSDDQE